MSRITISVLVWLCYSVIGFAAPPPYESGETTLSWVIGRSIPSVVKITRNREDSGTGFFYKNKYVVTAAHVVSNLSTTETLVVTDYNGQHYLPTSYTLNVLMDICVIGFPDNTLRNAKSLSFDTSATTSLGQQVFSLGFPQEYTEQIPLLAMGYISGMSNQLVLDETVKPPKPYSANRLVVDMSINQGNSGGPLIDAQTGLVLGVVFAKAIPGQSNMLNAIQTLQKQDIGAMHFPSADGKTTTTVYESRVVGEILEYLRLKSQLSIGYAIPAKDIGYWLKAKGF